MTENLPDYDTIEPPADTPREDYGTHERRAEVWRAIRAAGSPARVNKAALARKYDVARTTIYRDFERLREWVDGELGEDAKLTTRAVFERVVDDLLASDDWRAKKAAFDAVIEWNEWLAEMGHQHREPDRVEADVRTREVSYTLVRDAPDLPTTEDGDTVDTDALGFTEAPADIPIGDGGAVMTAAGDAVDEQQRILESTWQPFDEQQAIMQHPARFRICVCGRRWGKSEMAAHEALEHALETPRSTVWWVAPTYDQANAYGFDKIKPLLTRDVLADKSRSKPRHIDLVNGSTLSFRSAEREDSLRGGGVDFLVIDEASDVPTRAWTEVLRPTLADTKGRMLAIGTPKRRNWFHEWFQRGRDDDNPAVAAFQAPTATNPHVPREEIEHARDTNPDRVFRQEWQAEFLDETGGVFTDLETRVLANYDVPVPPEDNVPENDREDSTRTATPPFATGVDFARSDDYTVIVTLDDDGQVVHFDRVRQVGWPEIQRRVERATDKYPGPAALDATRDNAIVSNLEGEGVNVEPVEFTRKSKRNMIENLITAVENQELTLPDMDPLVHELEVFERDMTDAGSVRYRAPSGFKDDSVDALALAVHALKNATGGAASSTVRIGGQNSSDDHGRDGVNLNRVAEGLGKRMGTGRRGKWK